MEENIRPGPSQEKCVSTATRGPGDEKIRAAIRRNETSGQFLLCSDDSGQARERPGDSSGQREKQVLIVW